MRLCVMPVQTFFMSLKSNIFYKPVMQSSKLFTGIVRHRYNTKIVREHRLFSYVVGVDTLTLMLLANPKGCKTPEEMTETLAHGYSSESTQQELSNEYQLTGFRWSSKIFASLCFRQK